MWCKKTLLSVLTVQSLLVAATDGSCYNIVSAVQNTIDHKGWWGRECLLCIVSLICVLPLSLFCWMQFDFPMNHVIMRLGWIMLNRYMFFFVRDVFVLNNVPSQLLCKTICYSVLFRIHWCFVYQYQSSCQQTHDGLSDGWLYFISIFFQYIDKQTAYL